MRAKGQKGVETEGAELGNTNKAQPMQLIKWFFTFNNYTNDHVIMLIHKFEDICQKYIFEHEIGENGTPHLQGCIYLYQKMRWTEFNLPKEIHWEKCKDWAKAIEYCSKDYANNKTDLIWIKGMSRRSRQPSILKKENLYEYQKFILGILEKKPNERDIYWFWEKDGNVGKSTFCKYLVYNHDAIFIDEGKKADIMNHTLTAFNNGNSMSLFVLDIPRQNKDKISWKSIESIKNGLLYSPKYEGGQCIFNAPHVIIFSNFKPNINEETISKDRVKSFNICDLYEEFYAIKD